METQEIISRGLLRSDDICFLTARDERNGDGAFTGRTIITGEVVPDKMVKAGQFLKMAGDNNNVEFGFEIIEVAEYRASKDVPERMWYKVICEEKKLPDFAPPVNK